MTDTDLALDAGRMHVYEGDADTDKERRHGNNQHTAVNLMAAYQSRTFQVWLSAIYTLAVRHGTDSAVYDMHCAALWDAFPRGAAWQDEAACRAFQQYAQRIAR